MSQARFPDFATSIPSSSPSAPYIMGVWRDVARRFAFRRIRWTAPRAARAVHEEERRRDRRPALQLHRQGRSRGRAAARDDADARAHGRRARRTRCASPIRWFSIPQLFRYERQQSGRLREHFQLNVDIIGEADVTADAELLAVAIEIMRGCGLDAGRRSRARLRSPAAHARSSQRSA